MAHLDGGLGQEEALPEIRKYLVAWEDNILGLLRSPGGQEWFKSTDYLFDPTMVQRLKARLDAPDTLPPAWVDTMSWWNLDSDDQHRESRAIASELPDR